MYRHRVELDLTTLQPNVRQFIEHEIDHCSENDISVLMIDKPSVQCGSLKTNGMFNDHLMELAVAIGNKPVEQWIDTFIHETCHKDQFLEKARIWNKTVRGYNPFVVIDLWLDEVVELKELPKYQMIMPMLQLELDCEKRAAKKIRKHKLPIDIKTYTQKANSYVYFYHMLAETRKWYTIGAEPYNIPEVWQQMPTDFKGDYKTIPPALRKLYLRYCYNGKPRR